MKRRIPCQEYVSEVYSFFLADGHHWSKKGIGANASLETMQSSHRGNANEQYVKLSNLTYLSLRKILMKLLSVFSCQLFYWN